MGGKKVKRVEPVEPELPKAPRPPRIVSINHYIVKQGQITYDVNVEDEGVMNCMRMSSTEVAALNLDKLLDFLEGLVKGIEMERQACS